jgi:uncharacterized protein YeaO (DUF488 family)
MAHPRDGRVRGHLTPGVPSGVANDESPDETHLRSRVARRRISRLVDRLWPRGVSKQEARLDEWARNLAPSNELRRWFAHRPERFEEFRQRYTEELRGHSDEVAALRRRARNGKVTLLFAARDADHNDAVVLASIIRRGFPNKSC